MTASILSSNDLCTEIVIKIEHDRSMADFEDKLQDSLNEAGRIGVQKELEWLDTDGSPIMLGDIRLTSKSKKELKIYESPWGAVKVKRFVYQTSKGGAIFCPLDQTARIIVASTPRHARMVSCDKNKTPINYKVQMYRKFRITIGCFLNVEAHAGSTADICLTFNWRHWHLRRTTGNTASIHQKKGGLHHLQAL